VLGGSYWAAAYARHDAVVAFEVVSRPYAANCV
jgi:hypothetical protein